MDFESELKAAIDERRCGLDQFSFWPRYAEGDHVLGLPAGLFALHACDGEMGQRLFQQHPHSPAFKLGEVWVVIVRVPRWVFNRLWRACEETDALLLSEDPPLGILGGPRYGLGWAPEDRTETLRGFPETVSEVDELHASLHPALLDELSRFEAWNKKQQRRKRRGR